MRIIQLCQMILGFLLDVQHALLHQDHIVAGVGVAAAGGGHGKSSRKRKTRRTAPNRRTHDTGSRSIHQQTCLPRRGTALHGRSFYLPRRYRKDPAGELPQYPAPHAASAMQCRERSSRHGDRQWGYQRSARCPESPEARFRSIHGNGPWRGSSILGRPGFSFMTLVLVRAA